MKDVFLPAFPDQATLEIGKAEIAVATNSYVSRHLFFPGGDIGCLAVNGTINHLAIGGASPLYMTAAFLLEEDFPITHLKRIVQSMSSSSSDAGVPVVAGDIQVIPARSGAGLYINMTGIGLVPHGVNLSAANIRPGDAVLVSGSIAEHGVCIAALQAGMTIPGDVHSDCAPLDTLTHSILQTSHHVRCMLYPSQGGVAASLAEIADSAEYGILIEEKSVPVRDEVRQACFALDLDPLQAANEGKLIAIVAPSAAIRVLEAMQMHPLGEETAIIGTVSEARPGSVMLRSPNGELRAIERVC
jgi:hydrogenase expression/formation protein HypE